MIEITIKSQKSKIFGVSPVLGCCQQVTIETLSSIRTRQNLWLIPQKQKQKQRQKQNGPDRTGRQYCNQ